MLLVIIGAMLIFFGIAIDAILWEVFRKIGGYVIKVLAVAMTVFMVLVIVSLVICGMISLSF